MLPKEYIVKCNNKEECQKVYANFYNDNWICSKYNYIICSPKIKNAQFSDTGIYPDSNCITDFDIDDKFKHLPLFTYKQWLEMKDELKQDNMR